MPNLLNNLKRQIIHLYIFSFHGNTTTEPGNVRRMLFPQPSSIEEIHKWWWHDLTQLIEDRQPHFLMKRKSSEAEFETNTLAIALKDSNI